jgi:Common central domain of tyrosinase
MRLPINIYTLTRKHFDCHACWHEMRSPSIPQEKRNQCFPGLRALGQRGAGEDFLRFHREMIRNFKWLLQDAPGTKYRYRPWYDFPTWIECLLDAFHPTYRRQLKSQLDEILEESLDELGVYIEGYGLKDDFPAIHWVIHGIVSDFEKLNFGPQKTADMGKMETAPNNEHFWGLHGWIDNMYARWQRKNGEQVDQSPLEPQPHKMCDACHHLTANEFSVPRDRWRKYISELSE